MAHFQMLPLQFHEGTEEDSTNHNSSSKGGIANDYLLNGSQLCYHCGNLF
jgi:hypothetical protein